MKPESLPATNIGSIKTSSSVLGLGCWALGGTDWGEQSDTDSIDAIKAAYEYGINHFDTAQAYGKGHSEELLGRALKGVRDKVFIASKMMFSPKMKVEASIQASLRRLKTDYIDLFYIHWPKRNADLEGMMEGLLEAKEKGLISGIGVSNFSVEQMKQVGSVGKIDAHQICYNLLWRSAESELIPYCHQNGISVITYSSIAQGILTGKFEREIDFAEGDHRKRTVLFENDVWPYVYECVGQLKGVAEETKRSLRDLAIRWVLSRPGISVALVGARNSFQVEQNVKAMAGLIDESVFDRLTCISKSFSKYIPDTGNVFRWYP